MQCRAKLAALALLSIEMKKVYVACAHLHLRVCYDQGACAFAKHEKVEGCYRRCVSVAGEAVFVSSDRFEFPHQGFPLAHLADVRAHKISE